MNGRNVYLDRYVRGPVREIRHGAPHPMPVSLTPHTELFRYTFLNSPEC
jgi:hypothetical protein